MTKLLRLHIKQYSEYNIKMDQVRIDYENLIPLICFFICAALIFQILNTKGYLLNWLLLVILLSS
jgi:hypothetical protein